ncbi:MAG TPA: MgtC/SapB family protein [Bacteroidales bacterium]|nr:MgtC/SapB family protein [Bacteroidales bacterium]
MDSIIELIDSPVVSFESAAIKLIFSMIAGGLVGLNRERHKQPAGFRTHILICVGATLLMIVSIYIPQEYFNFKNGDPGRIAAQVVSGIGFLGAGAIIRLGSNIRGLTTAASIWLISGVGLCIGAGLYLIASLTVVISLFTLIVLDKIENRIFPQIHLKTLEISLSQGNIPDNEITAILKRAHIEITDFSISTTPNHSEIKYMTKISERTNVSQVIEQINQLGHVQSIKIN